MNSVDSPEKSYDPLDRTLVFVDRNDDLDPYSDSPLKAMMSCGHAVTPDSLTRWARSQIDQGIYKFKCPAVVKGTTLCNKPWSYQEVRRLADLTVEEMQYFEENMSQQAVAEYCEVQKCPKCKTNVERKDMTNLCVRCTICTDEQKKAYQFCWQCMKQWKGRDPRSDRCDNEGCANKNLELLQTCKTIDLPQVKGVTNCPSIRACPTCGGMVEHSRKECKNVVCPHCHIEFCFVCLKLTRQCRGAFNLCKDGVAPRQTSIPVGKRARNNRDREELLSAYPRHFQPFLRRYRRNLRDAFRLLNDDSDDD